MLALKINVKKIAFGNKVLSTDQKMGVTKCKSANTQMRRRVHHLWVNISEGTFSDVLAKFSEEFNHSIFIVYIELLIFFSQQMINQGRDQ